VNKFYKKAHWAVVDWSGDIAVSPDNMQLEVFATKEAAYRVKRFMPSSYKVILIPDFYDEEQLKDIEEEDYFVHINQYNRLLKENSDLRDALSEFATDEDPKGWDAIHGLSFAGTKDYISTKQMNNLKEKRDG